LPPEVFNPVILIPVYDGRDSVLRLIAVIDKLVAHPILIVDDGSRDGLGPGDVIAQTYLRHESNRGKGAALKTGLSHARSAGFTHAVTMDADGQHSPEMLTEFLAVSARHRRDLTVGSRDLVAEGMPLHRKLSNNITSLMLSLRTGSRVMDSQVGYRCYPLSDSRLWDSDEDGFQFESDIFLRARKMKMGLQWVKIPVIYGDQGSHMHLVLDTLRFVRMFLLSLIRN